MFFYQKESFVGMVLTNIAQIHKKRKHVFKQYVLGYLLNMCWKYECKKLSQDFVSGEVNFD